MNVLISLSVYIHINISLSHTYVSPLAKGHLLSLVWPKARSMYLTVRIQLPNSNLLALPDNDYTILNTQELLFSNVLLDTQHL